MNTTQSLFEGVIVMVAIISLVVLLKKITVLKKEDSLLFSRIVLQVTLPALIFSSLAVKVFDDRFVIMAAIMAVVEIGMIVLAWLLANLFKFQRGEKGALILVSAFGMTTMLGYPIIQQVFPNNPSALEYSPLFHLPALKSATFAGILLSRASIKPTASSATAIEFLPGQLET